MRSLYQDSYCIVQVDDDDRLVTAERTSTAFPSLETADAVFGAIVQRIAEQKLVGYGLLVDARSAPGRNDDEFESVFRRHSAELFAPFVRSATLVRTVVGVMQSRRMTRKTVSASVRVFLDEDEARAFLRGSGR